MYSFYCQWVGKECSWVTCRPVKIHLETDYIYICITCLGNLGKSGGTSLWLVKKHQSCILDVSSLILPLWEVRMVSSESHHIALVIKSFKHDFNIIKTLKKNWSFKITQYKRNYIKYSQNNVTVKAYTIMTWILNDML